MKRKKDSSHHPQWIPGPKMRMKTTMFGLIRALNDEIKPGEEKLVPLAVMDMIKRGLIKFPVGATK
jgi:hypothetical protein